MKARGKLNGREERASRGAHAFFPNEVKQEPSAPTGRDVNPAATAAP